MLRCVAACLLAMVLVASAWPGSRTQAPAPVSVAAEALYRQGILPDGTPLRGEREGTETVAGTAAACINCHRRSGLGMIEGQSVIPPITGETLFRNGEGLDAEMAMRRPETISAARSAYTEATLATALRTGVSPDGRQFSYLMPRFTLDDATMALLTGYLKQLSRGPYPGVGADTLQFATIITPDADPIGRQAMLGVLEQYFGSQNTFYRSESPPLQPARRRQARVPHRWQLHVWTLTGPPESWEAQLQERLHREPVFAVISGIGGKTWAPVHRFCERASIPCLLPNEDLPVVADGDFYNVYFSKGVLLEAELIAKALQDLPPLERPHRVVQVYRPRDIGADAAEALQTLASAVGVRSVNRPLQAGAPATALAAALMNTDAHDAFVLWLRPADLALLRSAPRAGAAVFLSGTMGGLEHAPLPEAWRGVARMTYPYELPALRAARLNYPLGWLQLHNLPILDERVQINTYIACSIMVDTFGAILDNFVRDYLVERLEDGLSLRLVVGYYPRLGLAPGQRFASKGGYLVRFSGPVGTQVAPASDWIVP